MHEALVDSSSAANVAIRMPCIPVPRAHVDAGQGGNFLDTAEVYATPMAPEHCGKTEEFVGRWMKERGCRDEFIIATKVCSMPYPMTTCEQQQHEALNRLDDTSCSVLT